VKDVLTNGFQERRATKNQSSAQSANLHIGIKKESKTFLNKTSLMYL